MLQPAKTSFGLVVVNNEMSLNFFGAMCASAWSCVVV